MIKKNVPAPKIITPSVLVSKVIFLIEWLRKVSNELIGYGNMINASPTAMTHGQYIFGFSLNKAPIKMPIAAKNMIR